MRFREPIISARPMTRNQRAQSILSMITLAGAASKVVQTRDAKIAMNTPAPS